MTIVTDWCVFPTHPPLVSSSLKAKIKGHPKMLEGINPHGGLRGVKEFEVSVSHWSPDRVNTCSTVSGDGEQHGKEQEFLHIRS